MRKILLFIVGILIVSPSCLYAGPGKILGELPELNQMTLQSSSPEELEQILLGSFLKQAHIQSIDDYKVYLNHKMTYKLDQEDIWEAPAITFARGYGDCEDLSFLTAAVLKYFGYKPRVIGFKKPSQSHVFVYVRLDDGYYIFDNTLHYKLRHSGIDVVADFLHRKHDIEFLIEVERVPRAIHLLYSQYQLQELTQKR